MTHHPSRRQILRRGYKIGIGATLGLPLITGGCPSGDASLLALPEEILLPDAPLDTPATVAVARGGELTAMTHDLLAKLGGIASVVRPGETVFIKPNLLAIGLGRENPIGSGECAKPEIAIAVAEACLIAGAADVVIGDGTQVPEFDWTEVVTLDGRTHIAAEVDRLNREHAGRVRLAQLNVDSPAWDAIATPRTRHGQLLVSSLVARADRLISIAVLKTHRVAGVSLTMKNLIGALPLATYGGVGDVHWRVDLHTGAGRIDGCILDLAQGVRPDLAIVDCSVGVERSGPWVHEGEGRTVDLRERVGEWRLLGGVDPVAVDATATRMIGVDPQAVPHLRRAAREGVGQGAAKSITLRGADSLDALRLPWTPVQQATLADVFARAARPY